VLALLLVIGLIGFGGYRASEYQGMQTLRTDAGHRLDLFGAAVDGIVNRYAHIPATIQLSEEVLALLRKPRPAGSVAAANRFLERLNGHIGSLAIFVMDERGIVLASSNWKQPTASSAKTCRSAATTSPACRARWGATSRSASPRASRATTCPTRSATASGWSAWRPSRSASPASTRPGSCSACRP
jgi:hypothetical protein